MVTWNNIKYNKVFIYITLFKNMQLTGIISDPRVFDSKFNVHARTVTCRVQLPVNQHRSQERIFGIKWPKNVLP
jgi:hypothetical protein